MSKAAYNHFERELSPSTRDKVLATLNDLISTVGEASPALATMPAAGRLEDLLRARRTRSKFFNPRLFADPAWDMLLELYAAQLASRRVSVSSLCIAADVPATTALRWMNALAKENLVEREDDPFDLRRKFVKLSATGMEAMSKYFATLPPHLAPL